MTTRFQPRSNEELKQAIRNYCEKKNDGLKLKKLSAIAVELRAHDACFY